MIPYPSTQDAVFKAISTVVGYILGASIADELANGVRHIKAVRLYMVVHT